MPPGTWCFLLSWKNVGVKLHHRTLTDTEEGIRHLSGKVVLAIAGITTVVMPMASQSPEQKPSFEVASVKPSTSGKNRVAIMEQPGGRFVATNVSLTMLMDTAYRVRAFQILGGPNWIGTDRWNIEAKADEGSIPPPSGQPDPTEIDPMTLMLQSLIEDRFHLKMRHETRQLPAYVLTVAKGGPKMEAAETGAGTLPYKKATKSAGTRINAQRLTMAELAEMLSRRMGYPVRDMTGLTGAYRVALEWAAENKVQKPDKGKPAKDTAGGKDRPSIFTALQEQLGLKLESAKGPVEVLVVDSVQKPSEN